MKSNKVKIKTSLFILLFVPYILHRYALNLTLLYWDQVIILIVFILSLYFSKRSTIIFDMEAKLYTLFVFTISLPMLIHQVDCIRDVIKYSCYSLVYLVVFRQSLRNPKFYRIFINIIVGYLLVSFPIYYYDFILGGQFYKNYWVPDMKMPTPYPLVGKTEFDFYFPFYLYVIPDLSRVDYKVGLLNVFGFYRYFGFSHESSVFALVVLPLVYISLDLRKYFSFIILSVFIWVVGSWAGISLWVLFTAFWFFGRFNKLKYLFAPLFISCLVYYSSDILKSLMDIPPLVGHITNYATKLHYTFSYEWISSADVTTNPYHPAFYGSTANFILNTLRYGIVNTFSFSLIMLFYVIQLYKGKSINKAIIFSVTIVLAQKGSYYFTPLIFFFINYIGVDSSIDRQTDNLIKPQYNLLSKVIFPFSWKVKLAIIQSKMSIKTQE